MLKLENLKDGEIYYIELNLPQHCNPIWIQKWKGSAINKIDKTFQKHWSKFGNSIIPLELRLATDEEKAWLEHCIKEDKFVEYEQFMKVYKPQFIVGQWYKNIGSCQDYIAPFVGIKDSRWLSNNKREYIWNNGYKTDSANYISKNFENATLVDIQEIQEFLPLDHPDKQLDIKQIQEECKKRFPIGCKFKNTEGEEEEFTLIQDHSVYKIVGNNVIWASSGYGYLYDKGKYAELIEAPEMVIPEYVEYIDTLYKGTIVKVEDWCCGSYCKVVFYNGNKEQPFKHLVKTSTKEAYDLQNNSVFPIDLISKRLDELKPLTPEQCYNTEIEVGDEVENIGIQHYNGAVCTENNNYTEKGIKGIVTKKGYSVGADCIAYEITWHNGKKCGKSINQVKLIKKANKDTTTTLKKKVDVSSPKVTDKITVPRINTTSYDTLVHINIETNTKSITIPKLETKSPEIKNIKIQSFSLTI